MTSRTVVAGLCDTCRWRRAVRGAASTFVLCTRGLADTAFPKYPALPVWRCRGFELAQAPVGTAGARQTDEGES